MKSTIAILGFAAACAREPGRSTLKPPTLKSPLDTLGFYVGSWKCKGTSFVTPDQPVEEKWDARVDVTPELDGKSLFVQMTGPGNNHTAEHKGYDPATKTWHHVAVGNGGSWVAMVSPGWEGERMVFSPAGGRDPNERATFTKRGEREYSHAVSRVTEHGEEKVWEKICTKS